MVERAAATDSLKPEAEIITPDVVEPVTIVEVAPEADEPRRSRQTEKKNDVQD